MDDTLVFSKDQSKRNKRLTAALECIQAAGATPNKISPKPTDQHSHL